MKRFDGGPDRSRPSQEKREGVATRPMPIVRHAQRDVGLRGARPASPYFSTIFRRRKTCASAAISGVAVLPVPIAQTGS